MLPDAEYSIIECSSRRKTRVPNDGIVGHVMGIQIEEELVARRD